MSGEDSRREPDIQSEMIDVTGLPEQVVEDIQNLVESIRKNLPGRGSQPPTDPTGGGLPRWEGTVLAPLSRRELYDDVG